jgi:hypothetical protein
MGWQFTGYTNKQHIVILSDAKLIPQKEQYPEMFESLAPCFAFRCSAHAQHDSAIDVRW